MNDNLVISRDPNLWDKKNTNSLIGDWCLPINQNVPNKRFRILKYYGEDKKKIFKNIKYLEKLYLRLLEPLVNSLNKYHGLNKNIFYWEMLLSRWLWHYLMYTFDRWEMLRSLRRYKNKFNTKIIKINDEELVKNDTSSFHYSSNDPLWNQWIISKMLNFFPNIQIKEIVKTNKRIMKEPRNQKKLFIKNTKFFFKNNDKFFFKNLSFDKSFKIKLNLLLGQFNVLNYSTPNYVLPEFKINKKRKKFKLFNKKKNNNYLNFLNENIKYQIPKVFLEGFKPTRKKIKNVNWPNKPKIIFTSISHLNDEIFKFYTAEKKENGSKLYVFQHGGAYMTDKLHNNHFFESRISDKFFSWGWKTNTKKIEPLFVTTVAGKKIKKNKNSNGILMSIPDWDMFPHKLGSFIRTISEIKDHISSIDSLISKLKKNTKKNIKIKFRKTVVDSLTEKEIIKKIKKKHKEITFYDNKKLRVFEESTNFKLVVETMNSTGLLECLSLNIPVVMLGNKKIIINDSFHNHYKKLQEAGIVHYSPKSLAEFINTHYPNIEKWWQTKKVQSAVNLFCKNICIGSDNPIQDFKKKVLKNAN